MAHLQSIGLLFLFLFLPSSILFAQNLQSNSAEDSLDINQYLSMVDGKPFEVKKESISYGSLPVGSQNFISLEDILSEREKAYKKAEAYLAALTPTQNTPLQSASGIEKLKLPETKTGKKRVSKLREQSGGYFDIIAIAAIENRLEPELIIAVMTAESELEEGAISKKGAKGLMQLMPKTAVNYGVKNVFDPNQNIPAGSAYLRDLLDEFQGNTEYALAAYNAGPQRVKDARGIPDIEQTKNFVIKVMKKFNELKIIGG